MKKLEASRSAVVAAYRAGKSTEKELLEHLFGKEVFDAKITDLVKSYEDACDLLGIDPIGSLPDVSGCMSQDRKSLIAFHKLTIIARALNDGWEPDWTNPSENKWFNWWYVDTKTAGLGYAYSDNAPSSANASVGSRLCFRTEALADYAAEQFMPLYEEYLLIK